MQQVKEPLRVTILEQAYANPRVAGVRFQTSKMCSHCGCEYVVTVEDLGNRQKLICQNCGVTFTEKPMVA